MRGKVLRVQAGEGMTGKGSTQLAAYLAGKRLTQRGAILAKCCDCMANYADGRRDCGMAECPLYPWMPYGAIWMASHTTELEIPRGNEAASISPGLEAMP